MVSKPPAMAVMSFQSWLTDSTVMPQARFGSVRQEAPRFFAWKPKPGLRREKAMSTGSPNMPVFTSSSIFR